MDMKDARRFATLLNKKRKLEDELAETKLLMERLEPLILNQMMEEKMPKLNLTDAGTGITLYPHTQLWLFPGDGGRESVCSALKRARLGEFVKEDYNTAKLSAWGRERIASGQDLPPSIKKVVVEDVRVSLRGRRTPVSPESTSKKAIKNLRR